MDDFCVLLSTYLPCFVCSGVISLELDWNLDLEFDYVLKDLLCLTGNITGLIILGKSLLLTNSK